jgi:hypothetical protein
LTHCCRIVPTVPAVLISVMTAAAATVQQLLTEHGPAGMDQLQLAVAAEGLGISGQTGSVPSVVTGKLSVQV